ncbi:MAG: hypothetical protein NVS3B3_15010 [Aquirhabdus sp.]
MKLFTQLALVSAIATCGSAAYAMQSMDDAALSDTTGQDGITILIGPPTLTAAQKTALGVTQSNGLLIGAAVLHDKDGFAGSLGGGAIVLGDAKQANAANAAGTAMGIFGSTPISVTIDASNGQAATGLGGTKPILNIKVGLPADLLIRTGDIGVDGTARAGIATGAAGATIANAATGGTTGNYVKILNSMDIALGGATMNIQLGNTQQAGVTAGQTTMIKAAGTITGGLTISNIGLIDANTLNPAVGQFGGGTLGVSTLTLKDTGAANLTLGAAIDVVADADTIFGTGAVPTKGGLIITVGGAANDIMMQNVTLGNTASTLGDLQLINVQAVGTHIAVQGH